MKFLTEDNDLNALEVGIRNKFRWEWFKKEDFLKETISTWCRKIDVPGTCFCTCCNTSIRYGSEGLKSLINHSSTATHQKARKAVRDTQFLQPFGIGISDGQADRTVDLLTRKC